MQIGYLCLCRPAFHFRRYAVHDYVALTNKAQHRGYFVIETTQRPGDAFEILHRAVTADPYQPHDAIIGPGQREILIGVDAIRNDRN